MINSYFAGESVVCHKFVPLSYIGSEVKECKLFMTAEKKLCTAFFSYGSH